MSEKEKLRRSAKEERSIATLADDSLESSALSSESSQNKSSARVWFDDTSLSNDKTHRTSAQRARKLQETRGAPKLMGSGSRAFVWYSDKPEDAWYPAAIPGVSWDLHPERPRDADPQRYIL
jgi:hypothetical protein